MAPRDPRAEAGALLEDGFEARVLEPSPPADTTPDVFADDPTDPSGAAGRVVSPAPDGDLTWDDYVSTHPEVTEHARTHWLGSLARLQPLPGSFDATRRALHQLAFFAVAPKRHSVNGKIGLRYTHGGFGTPFLAGDVQVRVEGADLVVDTPAGHQVDPITTVTEAARALGIEYRPVWFPDFHDPLWPGDPSAPLEVDPVATGALGDWFGFATHVLEIARRHPGAADVSRVQLWPEHFDLAFEMGPAADGRRASYGASPGDDLIPEPYLYVAAWGEVDRSDPFFDAEGFNGGLLAYSQLLVADDQRAAALKFLRCGYAAVTGQG